MEAVAENRLPLWHRLWIYQAERFPLFRHGPLIAVFAAAGMALSAALSQRALPGAENFGAAAIVALLFFFQLRVCDEIKDAARDRQWRPERPVPRGLVTQRELVWLALAGAVLQIALAAALSPWLLILLGAVWAWMALMAAEFFMPRWLAARPTPTMLSHMLIMPMIDFFIVACEWVPAGGGMAAGLWPFLALSFVNGCVLEIGRKTWAPENEKPGVESYSATWGPAKAVQIWLIFLFAATALTLITGHIAGALALAATLAIAAASLATAIGLAFLRQPSRGAQKRLENCAGIWVLASYLALGLAPIAAGIWIG